MRERPPGYAPLLRPPGDLLVWSGDEVEAVDVDTSERARQAKAIGNAITQLHREHYGRGATITRTIYQRDLIVAFLEDIYNVGERTLIDAGDQQTVKDTRQAFQMAMRTAFSTAVEEITGRKVIQFMSQVSFDPDMAAEIFVLEPPRSGDAAPNSGDGAAV